MVKDIVDILGLGFDPQPTAIYEANAGAVPSRYLATISLPLLVIIIYPPHILYHLK